MQRFTTDLFPYVTENTIVLHEGRRQRVFKDDRMFSGWMVFGVDLWYAQQNFSNMYVKNLDSPQKNMK